MTVDGIMFDHFSFTPLVVMVGCVSSKVNVCPHILDDVVMHILVKGDIF